MRLNKYILTLVFSLLFSSIYAQKGFRKWFPQTAITGQYAGSIGMYSIGYSKITPNKKIELGLLYGKIPKFAGTEHRTLSLKFTYNPIHYNINTRFTFEPIQMGVFLCQNFGENSSLFWGKQYPKGYYWWSKSLRIHGFVSTQLSYKMIESKSFDRISLYLEANTNDLYLYSYLPNTRTMDWHDIFFLGAGIKVYVK